MEIDPKLRTTLLGSTLGSSIKTNFTIHNICPAPRRRPWNHFALSMRCKGGVDVVGVVTPFRGGAEVVLHGDQVVELSVLLGVHEKGEVEEDGEDQVEVEKEEGEVKETRTWMTMRMR